MLFKRKKYNAYGHTIRITPIGLIFDMTTTETGSTGGREKVEWGHRHPQLKGP